MDSEITQDSAFHNVLECRAFGLGAILLPCRDIMGDASGVVAGELLLSSYTGQLSRR